MTASMSIVSTEMEIARLSVRLEVNVWLRPVRHHCEETNRVLHSAAVINLIQHYSSTVGRAQPLRLECAALMPVDYPFRTSFLSFSL